MKTAEKWWDLVNESWTRVLGVDAEFQHAVQLRTIRQIQADALKAALAEIQDEMGLEITYARMQKILRTVTSDMTHESTQTTQSETKSQETP